jgi:hypothetical protein
MMFFFVVETHDGGATRDMAIFIALPFIGFIIVLAFVMFLCKWRHQRKMNELSHKENLLLGHDELRAQQIGDTTLRVSVLTCS